MSLAYEVNTDLAYDTEQLRRCATQFGTIADELRHMASELDRLLSGLKDTGWTTPAGIAFQQMTQTNWEANITKYADLLDTLKEILNQSAQKYDTLTINVIEQAGL